MLMEGICPPPDAQINFDDLNLARTSGVSPSSSTSDGIILQISILACSARDSMRFILGITPAGPIMQCRRKREGRRIFIMIPAPYQVQYVMHSSGQSGKGTHTWLMGNDEYILSPSFQSNVHGTIPPSPSVGRSSRTASIVPIKP